jgi:heme oxygenase
MDLPPTASLILPSDPPSGAVDARTALRRATQHLHAEVDASLPLSQPDLTLSDYRAHLRLLLDWTGRLRSLPVDTHLIDTQALALATDLRECDRLLGAETLTPWPDAGPDVSVREPVGAFGWGVAYVVEGSQLGGQVMYRRLLETLAPHPLEFLHGAGRGTGANWKAFVAQLDAQLSTPEQVRAACEGAVEAFAMLLACHRATTRSA